MKRALFWTAVVAAFVMSVNAQNGATADAKTAAPVGIDFSLPDTNGKVHTMKDVQGAKGTVIIFLSAQCPVVRDYNDRINQIAADYAAKGINFVGINSNRTESPELVKAHAAAIYKFPMLIDKDNVFADKLGASVTPEVYYYNAKGELLYRGRIDNHRAGTNITEPDLQNAFDESLAGKPVTRSSANAFGCDIKRVVAAQ